MNGQRVICIFCFHLEMFQSNEVNALYSDFIQVNCKARLGEESLVQSTCSGDKYVQQIEVRQVLLNLHEIYNLEKSTLLQMSLCQPWEAVTLNSQTFKRLVSFPKLRFMFNGIGWLFIWNCISCIREAASIVVASLLFPRLSFDVQLGLGFYEIDSADFQMKYTRIRLLFIPVRETSQRFAQEATTHKSYPS
ncbi:hypothetical protein SADUNF_Sadunf15G0117100 [Salix dunnii]|uniref:Uncharacterized protein n=1 Tax=Salix dunnii TaxID=1413687 RepID=A0A835JFB7_9ROSI|nr:hypothetical protein SADUNF_Sadunf15G0117100 [Salix dunnii]